MDRRTFLTTMLQGTLAATLLPHSISPLLIAQYASPYYFEEEYHRHLRILALGIDRFGAYCTRMLAYSVQNVSCHEVTSEQLRSVNLDFFSLNRTIQQADLLFLFADATHQASDSLLSSCVNATAATGVQMVVVGPQRTDHPLSALPLTWSTPPSLLVANPTTARDLIALVADLLRPFSIVGIDYADVKAILQSGSRALFACSEARSTDRGAVACRQALEQLQQQGLDLTNCSGAMACIYGSSELQLDDYQQAITNLDSRISSDINFVFGVAVDEHLTDSVRVAILAMQ